MKINLYLLFVLVAGALSFSLPYILGNLSLGIHTDRITFTLQILFFLLVIILLYGYENSLSSFSAPRFETMRPTISQLVLRAKYEIPYDSAESVRDAIDRSVNHGLSTYPLWNVAASGNVIEMFRVLNKPPGSSKRSFKKRDEYFDALDSTRGSVAKEIHITLISNGDDMIAEVVAKPVMYYQVTQLHRVVQPKFAVEGVEIEVEDQIRRICKGALRGDELEPPTPSSRRPEDIFDENFLSELPKQVSYCLRDANKCYINEILAPCSTSIRKGLEVALRIKFQQLGKDGQIYGGKQTEIGFGELLRKTANILPNLSKEITTIRTVVKWFGDMGAHDPYPTHTMSDIKDNMVPKVKSFLRHLELQR